jgi:two-component system nitrogen regulation sensor histidine kinase NtrY
VGAAFLYTSVRVGGHLSRQLSRPIEELIGWTGHIRHLEPLPPDRPRRGAPEFQALRTALREMAEALEQGRARAIEAERLRAFRETARRVAHEMRNPLTPIRLAVAQLARGASPNQQEAIEVLVAESGRLEQLAREFTEFGRLPEGPAAPVDLAELLTGLARTSVPPTMQVHLALDPALPTLLGHYDPLQRAFSNIVRNAVEACDARGAIELSARPENGGVRVEIRDHGPGVPAALAGHLFEPYVTAKSGGTGLGLALAKQAVEMHQGAIAVEETPGGGATFIVRLMGRG